MSSGCLGKPDREVFRDQVELMAHSRELESHGWSVEPQDRIEPPTGGLTKWYLSTELVFLKVDDAHATHTERLLVSVPLRGGSNLTDPQKTFTDPQKTQTGAAHTDASSFGRGRPETVSTPTEPQKQLLDVTPCSVTVHLDRWTAP